MQLYVRLGPPRQHAGRDTSMLPAATSCNSGFHRWVGTFSMSDTSGASAGE
jgi:hypothetical protein